MASTKADEIIDCLCDQEIDLWKLRGFALTEGGFLNNSIRKRVWSTLLGIDLKNKSTTSKKDHNFVSNASGFPLNVEIEQIDRDVIRSSWHLLTLKQRQEWESDLSGKTGKLLEKKQMNLSNLIKTVLQESYHLHYYQGFHDIAAIFSSIFTNGSKIKQSGKPSKSKNDLSIASILLQRASHSHLYDFMQSDFTSVTAAIQLVIFPMIQYFDPKLHAHLMKSRVEPYFALSWILTWFSHDIRDTKTVARLFDVFLASHPIFPLYLSVAMVLHPVNRKNLVDTEIDFATMHMALQTLPKKICTVAQQLEGSNATTQAKNGDYCSLNLERAVSSDQLLLEEANPLIEIQDLIDNAISYMYRLPPRKLIPLAEKYENGKLHQFLKGCSDIKLLQNPPFWAIAPTIPSDTKSNVQNIASKKSSKKRRKRATGKTVTSNSKSIISDHVSSLHENKNQLDDELFRKYGNAVIASGMGPDGTDRKRRKLLILGGIGFVVAAFSIGYAWIRWSHEDSSSVQQYCDSNNTTCPLKPEITFDEKLNRTREKNNWILSIYQHAKVSLNTEADIVLL